MKADPTASGAACSPAARVRRAWAVAMILLGAIVGALLLLVATRHGIGLVGDSGDYVRLALLMGRDGLIVPETHFPPLYPAMLRLLGDDPARWRVLHAMLLGIAGATTGLAAWRWTRALVPSVAAAGVVALSPDAQAHFAMVMSEAPFVALLAAAVAVLAWRPGLWWSLVVAGLLLGMSALVRHAGLFFGAGLTLAMLLQAVADSSRRRRHLARAALAGSLAIGPWLAWRWLAGDAEAARVVRWHPAGSEELLLAPATWGGWFAPGASLHICAILGLLVGGWIMVRPPLLLAARRGGRAWRHRFELALCTMALAYAAGILASRAWLDAAIPLGGRIWLPLLPLVVVLLAGAVSRLARRGRFGAAVAGIAIAVVVGWNAFTGIGEARRLGNEGIGYATPAWRDSETIAHLRALPAETPILTNAADVVLLLAGREATPLPMTRYRTVNRPNTRWRDQLAEAMSDLEASGGVVAYFHAIDRDDFLVTQQQLRERYTLEATQLADGVIYRVVRR